MNKIFHRGNHADKHRPVAISHAHIAAYHTHTLCKLIEIWHMEMMINHAVFVLLVLLERQDKATEKVICSSVYILQNNVAL